MNSVNETNEKNLDLGDTVEWQCDYVTECAIEDLEDLINEIRGKYRKCRDLSYCEDEYINDVMQSEGQDRDIIKTILWKCYDSEKRRRFSLMGYPSFDSLINTSRDK
jgi:hypothetical protein